MFTTLSLGGRFDDSLDLLPQPAAPDRSSDGFRSGWLPQSPWLRVRFVQERTSQLLCKRV
jgi:hypothetical protein